MTTPTDAYTGDEDPGPRDVEREGTAAGIVDTAGVESAGQTEDTAGGRADADADVERAGGEPLR